VVGLEPIWLDGKVQGFCTSAAIPIMAASRLRLALSPARPRQEGLEVENRDHGPDAPAAMITCALVRCGWCRGCGGSGVNQIAPILILAQVASSGCGEVNKADWNRSRARRCCG